jgi:shikimate dehydrogenase
MKLGLIGKKLSHSFSKQYFEKKFDSLKIRNFTYDLWEIDNLKNIRKFIENKKNVLGFNITIPYKTEIIEYLDIVSDEVKGIGACNCVLIKNNQWIGFNTDWWGFMKMIENKLEPHHHAAIILGTGGSAKAVSYALKKLHIPFIFVSRKFQPHLSNQCITYDQLHPQYFSEYPIIINTTPLGMFPDTSSMPPIPINFIYEKNFVIDIIYNPKKTLLLQKAEEKKAKILNGLEMLYLQAEKSWYIWQEIND